MRAYFNYLGKNIWTKAAIWIGLAIYWIYAAVLLLIIPGVTHVSPISLWTTDMVSLTGLFYVVLSVVSGLFVVYIFRMGIENETELIILSKPIKRWKISIDKYVWVMLGACVAAAGVTILILFTMCFGKYDNLTNPGGMKFDKVGVLIASVWVATFIIALVFSSIGILISNIANHIQILVALIASSVVVATFAIIVQAVVPSLATNIKTREGDFIRSRILINGDGQTQNYAYLNNQPADDLYEVYLDSSTTANRALQYINIGHQFSNLYNSFNLNNLDDLLEANPFGQSVNYDTIIKNSDDNLLNNLISCYRDDHNSLNDLYLALPYYDFLFSSQCSVTDTWTDSLIDGYISNDAPDSGVYMIGIRPDDLLLASFVDAKATSVYVSSRQQTLGNVIPAIWFNNDALVVSKDKSKQAEFDKAVFNRVFLNLLNASKSTWWLGYNTSTDKDADRIILNNFLNVIWNFLNDSTIQQEFNIPLNNDTEVNDAVAYVQYSLIKDFNWEFWKYIVPNYLTNEFGSATIDNWNTLLYNGCDEQGILPGTFTNTMTYWDDILTQTVTSITDLDGTPHDIATANPNFYVANYLQYFYTYCDTNWFDGGSFISSYHALNNRYNSTCAPITINGSSITYNWTSYDSNGIFNAFMAKKVETNKANSHKGITHIYHYESQPFVDNTTAFIFWLSVCIILWLIAMVVYNRLDIK